MLTCKDASALLSQAQDRPLGLRERLVLKLHLLLCHGCTHFGRQLKLIRATVQRIRDDD